MKIRIAAEQYAGMQSGACTVRHSSKAEAPFIRAASDNLWGFHSRAALMVT